jgi:hypothetical protein
MRIKTGSPHCHSWLVALQDGSIGWQGLVCAEEQPSLLFGVAGMDGASVQLPLACQIISCQVTTAPGIMKMKALACDCDS